MAKKKGKMRGIGAWAFIIGVVLAIVLGIFSSQLGPNLYNGILGLMIISGILVGLLNVDSNDASKFLLAAVSLVIVSVMGGSVISALGTVSFLKIGIILGEILNALLFLFIPATIIVALKSVLEIARE
ncbi:hypothetical protein HOD75_04800 [archaeon]|jgi:hypothetical protein|nr:hypothetical protein [archaeon]MBT4242183.1 hypothetical protein [archaeon]MBT4417871.1 hypothetical protein [archaeon]